MELADTGSTAWYNDVPSTINSTYLSDTFVAYTQNLYSQLDTVTLQLYDATIDANGHETETFKDTLGRVIETVYPDGSFTETDYNYGASHGVAGTDKK